MNPAPKQKIPHILILEDDASHRELCTRAFRDDPDRFRVSVVATLRDARSVIEQDPPDLIIADWLLPEGRGIDILPRKDGRVTIPLIIMTSHGDEHVAVEVMKSGAVDYMVKSASLFKGLPHIARRSLGFWENIKERKQAEEEAAESHKRLADILSFLPDATFAIDHEGRVIAWNRAIAEMTGVLAEEILGKGDYAYSIPFYGERRPILIDLVQEDDAEILKKYGYVKRDGGKITSEAYIPTLLGGRGAYLWGTASPLFDSAGTRVGAIEVIRDITKRKEDEDLLTRRQIALDALLNAPHDTIALIDRKGRILNINTEGARRLGGTAGEMIGESAYARLPPDLAESRRAYVDRVFATGTPAIFDDERSGTYLHNEIFPVFNPEKTAVDYVAVFARDITGQKLAEHALQESERNLSRAQEIGHLGSWNWDITGNRLFWSDEMYRIFGVSPDFVLDYDTIASLIHPDDRERNDQYIRDLLAGGNAGEFEFRIVRPDGTERWIFQKIEVARDSQGTALAAFGIVQDITDRKAAEQALFESEKKYRFLIDNILDSVWQTTPELIFTYVSPAVKHQLGYAPEEIKGTSLFDLLTEPSSRYVRHRLKERMEDYSRDLHDLSSLLEVEMVHRDGSIRSFEVSVTAIFGPDGSVDGFQGVTRDITERKRVETALFESEERFRDLFNNMGAGVVVYEPVGDGDDFVIRDINRAVESIEKVKKEEIVGKSVRDAFPGVVEFGLFDVFLRVARTGIPESHPVSLYTDNRISGWRDNYVYRLPSGEVIALYEDVTEKKQAEEDRERLLAEVEEEREKLSSLVSSITDEVWFADMEHRFMLANPQAIRVFGLEAEEMIPVETLAGSLTVLRHDGTPRPVEEAPPLRALAGEVVRNLEEIVKTPLHGELRYRLVSSAPVRNSSGTIIGAVSVVRDITEMKRAEEALRISQAQLKGAMDLARLVNWEFDALTGIFTFNDRFYSLYGTTAEQEGGYQMPAEEYARRFVPPEEQDLVAKEVSKAIESTDPAFISQVEHRIVRRDGEIRTIVVRFGIIQDENGRTVRTHGANQDITDRKRMEQALFESEAKLRRINDNAPDMIFRMSLPEGVYEYVSPASVALTGYTPEEFYKEPGLIRRLIHPAWKAYLEEQWQALLQENVPPVFEFQIIDRAGNIRWNNQRNIIIRDESGTVVAIEGIITDVTQRKDAELALAESEERYRGLMDHLPDYVIVHRDGILLYVNPSAADRMGFDPKTLVGRPILQLIDPAYHDIIRKSMAQRMEGKDLPSYEIKIVANDGTLRTVLVNGVMIQYGGGPASLNVLTDITLQKEAEEIRRAYELRLDSAMEIGSLAWWEMDLPDRTFRFDDRMTIMLGYSPGSFRLYADFTALLHPDDLELAMQAMRDHLEGRASRYYTDYRIRTAGGNYRWFRDVGGITRHHPDGSAATVTGIVMDITERKIAERALAEDATRRKLLVDQSRDGIVTLDQDGKVFEANQRFADMLGYSADEIRNLHVWDWDANIEPGRLQQMITSVDTSGDHFETCHRRKDGHVLDVEISTNAVVSGNEKQIFCVVRDISEKKAALKALEESENRFRALIQNASDLIRILDADGRILYESPSAERILGYPEGSLLGTDPLELVHPDDLERARKDLDEVYGQTNTGTPTEFRIRKADGEYLWVDTIGTNLLDAPGVNGVVVTTRPIQQRKEAEQAIRESEERLRLAMEGADISSWDWDLKANTAVFSDRFYTMLGYLPGEFSTTYEEWAAHIHPDDRERVLSDLMRQIAEKSPLCEIEYRFLTKDGNWLWILGRGKIAEFDENGTPSRMTGVNIDITNRRLMESEIRSLNTVLEERVKDRTEALQEANAALEEENAQRIVAENKLQASYNEKVTLLKEIHHRVKNNLQIIASLLNLQSRYIHDDATLATIRESQNRVRAMALVHEKLYKAEDISHISLGEYVSFLGAGLFQFYDAKSRGIRFQLDIEEINVDINTAIPLGLIINELISNSLKYAFPGGRKGAIAISVKKTDQTLAVTYSDDGIGIPADLDWQNTQSLGLRLVNTLVDQLDGTIGLDRSNGTRFTMEVHDKEGT